MPKEIEKSSERKLPAARKSLRSFFYVLLAFFLFSGIVFGLSVSGALTEIFESVRPVLVEVPFVGEPLVALMDAPERPLNSMERRALELEQMESMLVEREERLRKESMKLASDQTRLEKLQGEIEKEREKMQQGTEFSVKSREKEAAANLIQGFEDMSSRKAAATISRLSGQRAVEIMKAINQEKMAEILAKMDPGIAAKMVEILSREEIVEPN